MVKYLITTIDNPFNPFTQFDDWYRFDIDKGYNTCAYLARIAITSNELSEQQQEEAIDRAVDEIARLNILGIYKKVKKDDEFPIQKIENEGRIEGE